MLTRASVLDYKNAYGRFPAEKDCTLVGIMDINDLTLFLLPMTAESLFDKAANNIIKKYYINTFKIYKRGVFFIVQFEYQFHRSIQVFREIPSRVKVYS